MKPSSAVRFDLQSMFGFITVVGVLCGLWMNAPIWVSALASYLCCGFITINVLIRLDEHREDSRRWFPIYAPESEYLFAFFVWPWCVVIETVLSVGDHCWSPIASCATWFFVALWKGLGGKTDESG